MPCLQDLIAFTVPVAETKQSAFRLSLGLRDWPPKVGLMVQVCAAWVSHKTYLTAALATICKVRLHRRSRMLVGFGAGQAGSLPV